MDFGARSIISGGLKLAERALDETYFAAICMRSGVVGLEPPHRMAQLLRAIRALRPAGRSSHSGCAAPWRSDRHHRRARQHDATRSWMRTPTLWPTRGVSMAFRPARASPSWFATTAASWSRCSPRPSAARASSCSTPRLRLLRSARWPIGREHDLLVHDEEYGELLSDIEPQHGSWYAWTDEPRAGQLDALMENGDRSSPPKPAEQARITILTSGTTGTPKGAPEVSPSRWGCSAVCSARSRSGPGR